MRLRWLIIVISCTAVVSGCGADTSGDGTPADVKDTSTKERPTRVIATLGDSIVAGSPLWDPDPDVRATFTSATRKSQWQYWVDLPAGTQLRNCGVWGERTDEIAKRYAACTKGADAIVIQGGINDIVQGRPLEQIVRNLACIAERARTDKLPIALVDVLPWNNGFPKAATPIRTVNARIAQLGKASGVPVLPFFATLDDPKHRDRMPKDLTEDGNHPTVDGYRLLGERAWREPVLATSAFVTDC